MELWDVYDKHRKMTELTHERGIPMKEGDYHIVVHVWIINDKGQILIQKRQPWKKGWPDMWDCSVAGAARQGDDSKAAAIRETKEELGIDLDMNNAEVLFTEMFFHGFDDVWVVYQNVDINELKLQYEEVAEVKWSSEEEIMIMVQNGEFINHIFLDKFFKILNSNIKLKKATINDTDELLDMQKEVFMPLYKKYEDHNTSPALQTREKFIKKFNKGDYYKIIHDNNLAGSVFVFEKKPGVMKFHIINIFENYQNRGIAQEVMKRLEFMYPQADTWVLETILSEKRNCYLYEKIGYVQSGEFEVINDKLTLVHYIKKLNSDNSI